MPSYLHPGVYVEEIPSGSKPIEGVGTSTAAFVGKATKGPSGEAELIQNFSSYTEIYGDVASKDDAMGLAVQSFYLNGGKSAYICRLAGQGSLAASTDVLGQGTSGVFTVDSVLNISATSPGTWGNNVYFRIIKPDQDSLTFDLEIGHQENNEFVVKEEFNNLSMIAEETNYALSVVNGNSAYAELSLGDAANPNENVEQFQAATLIGGEIDSNDQTYFSSAINGEVGLTLNINGLGAEYVSINIDPLSFANHNADGDLVAAAIKSAVKNLSLDAAHQAFDCTYEKAPNRFKLTSVENGSEASLEVYDGVIANLLRLDKSQTAIFTSETILGGATKFSSVASGLPSLIQPMMLALKIDEHGEFSININASNLTLIGDKASDADTLARAIQNVVQASNPAINAYKDFTCTYNAPNFVLTSGSGNSRQSTIAVSDSELAAFLKLQAADSTTLNVGRQVEQGTSRVVPTNLLGTHDKGVSLKNGKEEAATANDYTKFYNTVLRKVRDVSLIVTPGEHWANDGSGNPYISATLAHCQAMKSRVVIIDPPPNVELDQGATVTQLSLPSSTYSVLYYPWVKVANPFYNAEKNPTVSKTLDVAPSSFAAGMWSRIDAKRGVWKAPAGMETGLVGSAGLKYIVGDGEQDQLNPLGINCLRNMPGGGRVIWGARTLATKADPEWRYVPVRRTAIMIEQSIFGGIQWAVFEPNDHRLWSALRANIGNFMNGLFRVGAFQGEKASDAYFVRCGLGDTMTQGEIDAGQVIVTVGFAPLKPAEFVIVRIQQKVNQQ